MEIYSLREGCKRAVQKIRSKKSRASPQNRVVEAFLCNFGLFNLSGEHQVID